MSQASEFNGGGEEKSGGIVMVSGCSVKEEGNSQHFCNLEYLKIRFWEKMFKIAKVAMPEGELFTYVIGRKKKSKLLGGYYLN